jgi:hypothetical protein
VRGGGANKLIRAADRAEEDLVLAQGFLWQKSKTPNGNQIILEALCEVPEVVRESALRSLSLTDVQRVVEQYQQYQQFNQETGDL